MLVYQKNVVVTRLFSPINTLNSRFTSFCWTSSYFDSASHFELMAAWSCCFKELTSASKRSTSKFRRSTIFINESRSSITPFRSLRYSSNSLSYRLRLSVILVTSWRDSLSCSRSSSMHECAAWAFANSSWYFSVNSIIFCSYSVR